MIEPADLATLLPDFLVRQRWYGANDLELTSVEISALEVWRDEWPSLLWVLVDAQFADDSTARFQIPVGLRPLDQTERFLEGKGRSMLGDVDTPDGPALVYDALVDPELALAFLRQIAPDEHVERVRSLNVEQSNTSVVYDERLIMKLFRRLAEGPNPDVEVTEALARVGFTHISAPVATWRRDGIDLAVVREFLEAGTEGWQLALTSLRDVYGGRLDPAESGGDFAPEASRLGQITAQMHLKLAEAFGAMDGEPKVWADTMLANLSRSRARALDAPAIAAAYDALRSIDDPGKSIRIHGDYHLAQTMRTDNGWYILDFEGEPALPLEERRKPSSPLRDVAGMLRSFHYAAEVGLAERGGAADDDELRALGARWEQHVGDAYRQGYFETEGIDDLLPATERDRETVLNAFILAKAVYEIGYELAHRPEWVRIPLEAVSRLVDSTRG
ncbi:MAG: maltokinase [Acidimicrobiaceae bacterium]|jgi:maltokinase